MASCPLFKLGSSRGAGDGGRGGNPVYVLYSNGSISSCQLKKFVCFVLPADMAPFPRHPLRFYTTFSKKELSV